MFQAIGKNSGAKFLNEYIPKIILERFGNTAYHCSAYQQHQEKQQTMILASCQRKIHVQLLEVLSGKTCGWLTNKSRMLPVIAGANNEKTWLTAARNRAKTTSHL